MNNSKQSPSIPPLTGLRFIAALMVFFSHFPIPGSPPLLHTMMASGYSGVTFFFILSGFVLTYNHLDFLKNDPHANVIHYFIARFSRIYPLYLFCILFAYIQAGSGSPLAIYLWAMQAWSPDVYIAFGLDGPAWSISVEAFLYLCFPLMILFFHSTGITQKKNYVLTAMLVIIVMMFALALFFTLTGLSDLPRTDPLSAHRWLYRTPLTRLFDFALGGLAAIYYRRFAHTVTKKLNILLYIAIIWVIGVSMSGALLESAVSFDAIYAVPFITIILVLALNPNSKVSRLLSSRSMLLLGESSYAFYLIHALFVPSQTNLSLYIMDLFLLVATSIGLHIALEKPCQKAIKKVYARIASYATTRKWINNSQCTD